MCNLINIQVISLIPWEDQREWHRMSRMTGPDCAVMCNLINIHTNIQPYPVVYLVANPVCGLLDRKRSKKGTSSKLQREQHEHNKKSKTKTTKRKEHCRVFCPYSQCFLSLTLTRSKTFFDYSGGLLAALRFYNTQTKSTCQKNIEERHLIVRLWYNSAAASHPII